jgi:hypothetical protein
MGGSSARSSGTATGTNAEEISLANLTGSSAINISPDSYTNKRPQYLTPGMLLEANGGVLTDTNDLRYFTSRLPKCLWTTRYTNYDRIPYVPISSTAPYYPTNPNVTVTGGKIGAGARKYPLTSLNLGGQSAIAAAITNSFPMFTSRAGGMNGNLYVNALAANIVDYADADSSPTIVNVGGVNAVGYDSYPLLTHLYDQFLYSSANRTITHTTWMQFWNPSTQSTTAGNITVNFTNNDTIRYVNTAVPPIAVTARLYAAPGGTTATFNLPAIPPNAGFVTSFIRPAISLANVALFPGFTPANNAANLTLYLNTAAANINTPLPCANSFSYQWGGATITPAMTTKRQNNTLVNNLPTYGAGFLAGNKYIAGAAVIPTSLPIHDPRMTPYLGLGSANQYFESAYATTFWRGYVSQSGLTANMGLADPAFWPDASSANVVSHGSPGGAASPNPAGAFQNPEPAPCKVSNFGSYTNICELGNIFDPIQWRSPQAAFDVNLENTNISSGWFNDSLYGGGSTLRIGRPEHSRFAFTNLGGTYPVPSLGTSAVGLLELFCATNTYNWAGKININTAPLPVLAALAGGITLQTGTYSGTAPANMVRAFTNGVAKFRQTYPFITPSQLAFISSDYGDNNWTNTWPINAVFATNVPTGLPRGGLSGPTAVNDAGREEWFSKIYNLTCVQSFNYRIYVVAQLTDTNGNPKGAIMRKYYDLYLNNNTPNVSGNNPDLSTPSISPIILSETPY